MVWSFLRRMRKPNSQPRRTFRPAVEALEDRVVPYNATVLHWAITDLSVSYMPDGTPDDYGHQSSLFAHLDSIAPREVWQQQFVRALQTWASYTNLNFHFVPDDGSPSQTF